MDLTIKRRKRKSNAAYNRSNKLRSRTQPKQYRQNKQRKRPNDRQNSTKVLMKLAFFSNTSLHGPDKIYWDFTDSCSGYSIKYITVIILYIYRNARKLIFDDISPPHTDTLFFFCLFASSAQTHKKFALFLFFLKSACLMKKKQTITVWLLLKI